MATLTSRTVADSYYELLKVDSPFTSSSDLRQVEDGVGNLLPLQISQEKVKITGELELSNTLTLGYPINSTWTGASSALAISSTLVSAGTTSGALTVAGGVGIGLNLYVGDNLNVLGQSFFTGNSKFYGSVEIDGTLTLGGNIFVGNADTDNVSFVADINSNLIPDVTETYNIGSTTKRWNQVWSKDVTSKNLTVSETVSLSPNGGAASVTISPTTILTVNPTGTTSTLNNVTIGGTTPRSGTFSTLTQSGSTGTAAFQGTTDSTTSTTGAVTIAGGVGVAKNLNVGSSLSVASTGSNSVTFNPPFTANSTSTFTNLVTINPPNTTVQPLRIANNGSDAVTVDTAGQLNVLKTSVYTGKATFNGIAEVNNVFQQVASGSTSTFAGPLTLNNTTTSLTANGPSVFRGFTARNSANSATTLTFANDTGALTISGLLTPSSLSINSSAFAVSTSGFVNANDSATICAGSSNSGSIILAGSSTTTVPAVSTRYLRLRQVAGSTSDIATVDFGDSRLTVAGRLDLSTTGVNGTIGSDVRPWAANTYDLGSSSRTWKNLFLSNNLTIGGTISASASPGAGAHYFAGDVIIGGTLSVTSSTSTTSTDVSSLGKTITLNVASEDTVNKKIRQSPASSALSGGVLMSATLPLQKLNTVVALPAAVETIAHDFNVPISTITAIRRDTNVDVSALFTWTQTTNLSVTVTWGATALGSTTGAVGNVVFTLTPQASYGYYGLNTVAVASAAAETVNHGLLTNAITVVITNASTDAVIPATQYAVTTPTTSTATITWNATATAAAIGAYRISVAPTAAVQKYTSLTYTAPVTGTFDNNEPQWVSSDNFGLSLGKSYFINNTRVLTENSLGDGVTLSRLTRVGIIGSGGTNSGTSNIWRGNVIEGQYGGTGYNNTGRQLRLGADLEVVGTNSILLNTLSGTNITLPSTGTLVTLSNTETLTNKTLGSASGSNITIPSGALSADLAVVDGGTGRGTLTSNAVLFGNGTGIVGLSNVGTDKQVLVSNSGVPTFATLSPTITLTGDVTGTGTMTDLGNVTINTTVGSDKVALGADTTGNYTESVAVSGSGLSITNAAPTADGAQYTISSNATALNNTNTLVLRDGSGNFSAGTITASLSGNATSASSAAKWTTSRTLTLSGVITGDVTFDGSGAINMTNTAYTAGNITNTHINATANIADTKLATISTAGKVANSATTAKSCTGITDPLDSNFANSIVSRDASGSVTVRQLVALEGIVGTASDVLDNVSTQRVKVTGFDSLNNAVTSEKSEIVFSSNSNCSVFVSTDPTNTKTNVQVFVPAVGSYLSDFNDANFIVSDDGSGARIKFKLDSLSSASSAGSGAPRELIISDNNQTVLGYTNSSPIVGTPGTLTTFPFLKWDSVPKALEIKIAGSTGGDAPQTAYIPFYTS